MTFLALFSTFHIAGEVFIYFNLFLVFFFFGSFCFSFLALWHLLVLERGAMPSSKMVLSVSPLFCFWPVVCITPLATVSIRGFFALVFLSFSLTVISVVGHHI